MKTEIVNNFEYKRLTVDELNNLSTHRLLALLRTIRIRKSHLYYDVNTCGDKYYLELLNFYTNYYNDIVNIMNNREHIPRKKKKSNTQKHNERRSSKGVKRQRLAISKK